MTIFKDKSLLDTEIDQFFFENKELLKLHYAGININYLKQFFSTRKYYDFYALKKEMLLGIPFSYMDQRHFFYENQFFVNNSVLIPRNETELLVEKALNLINQEPQDKQIRIIDMGCGSGCIGLSLIFNTSRALDLTLSDISHTALDVARKNYEKLSYNMTKGQDVSFILSDRFQNIEGVFDLILSNPPYIKKQEHKELVHTKAHEHEPHLALYLDDHLYEKWFDDFFKQIKEHSHADTKVLIELHEDTIIQLSETISEHFLDVKVIKDLTGRERFLSAKTLK